MSLHAQLDHVVLLLPYDDVINPPSWLTDLFVISPGGRHQDGRTENRLVLFSDGTYLELIAFINDDASKRAGHWWDKPYGVVDFALTTPDAAFGELVAIQSRLAESNSGIAYDPLQEGGRITPDGTELRWKVTFPKNTARGTVPFFCHDLTPRSRRVPLTPASTSHPSGATGLAGVHLEVGDSALFARLNAGTAAILGQGLSREGRYEVGVPRDVPDAKTPSLRIRSAESERELKLALVLQSPQAVVDVQRQMGDGMVEVVFEKPV